MLSTRLSVGNKLTRDCFGTSIMDNAEHRIVNAKPCPTCGAPAMYETRPFCSKRCADIDLGRWFQGAYAIAAVDAADDSIVDAELATSGTVDELDTGEHHG